MTFDPAVPLATESPAVFPAQNQTNMTVLNTNIARDHQFNNTPNATPPTDNTGYHNLIHMTIQAPSLSLASTGRLYVKTASGLVNLFYMDDAATAYQITPTMPIRAAVNFAGSAVNGAQVLRSSYNVTSVTRTGLGSYTVTFTTAMPNADYIVQVSGMREAANKPLSCEILGDLVYGNSVTTTFVKIQFRGESALNDPIMGNVTIFSAT